MQQEVRGNKEVSVTGTFALTFCSGDNSFHVCPVPVTAHKRTNKEGEFPQHGQGQRLKTCKK